MESKSVSSDSNPIGWVFGGAALGAMAVFFYDPVQGRRRRSLLRDQFVGASNDIDHAFHKYSRHFSNIWKGWIYRRSRAYREAGVFADPSTLVNRVRSEMGRHTRHPGAIEVTASPAGVVTVRGPVLADEAAAVLESVRHVRGVRDVIDQLNVHEAPSRTPSLQGEGKPYLQP